jgi:hypothetical protein
MRPMAKETNIKTDTKNRWRLACLGVTKGFTNMNHFLLPAYTIFVLLLGACANPNILTKRQSGDSAMSCDELGAAIGEAEELKKEARQEKGITGTNVAAGLLFWPALLISYNNIGQAVDATNARISHLLEIGAKKHCSRF